MFSSKKLFVTHELAPIAILLAMLTPPTNVAPIPITTLLPIVGASLVVP